MLNEVKKEIQLKNGTTMISMTKDTITLTADNIVLSGGKAVDLKTKDATIKASGALNLSSQKATLEVVEEE